MSLSIRDDISTKSTTGRSVNLVKENRERWLVKRQSLENSLFKVFKGGKSLKKWNVASWLFRFFSRMVFVFGLYRRGRNNARKIHVEKHEHQFSNLPESFDNLTILHLSDLHIDERTDLFNSLPELLAKQKADLIVITGDFASYHPDRIEEVENQLTQLAKLVTSAAGDFGVLAVLGNHDHSSFLPALEKAGVNVLVNEKAFLHKNNDVIQVIGTDDVHYFYSPAAEEALDTAGELFTVGLIHSPELYQEAAQKGVELYLCGHTHAGQIALPGGIPVFTHLKRGRPYYRGVWNYQGMVGFTSPGVGTTSLTMRFNTRGAVVLHTLKQAIIS